MNRLGLQTLAQMRLEDAKALEQSGQYAGAYYLAGFAVECRLKACIARKTSSTTSPTKPAPPMPSSTPLINWYMPSARMSRLFIAYVREIKSDVYRSNSPPMVWAC